MLPEALTALAAAGGTTLVQAAGSDAWEGLRGGLARWFGHGDTTRERGELERLDRSAAELAAATSAGAGATELARARQVTAWATRIETRLEGLDGERRDMVVAELRQLLEEAASATAGGPGLASGNTFHDQTAFQAGNFNRQDVRFGSRP